MLVETAMGLASPWPLKIVLDSVFDHGRSRAGSRSQARRRSAGAAERRGRRDDRHRAAQAGGAYLGVLHRQHRPVDRARPAPERLPHLQRLSMAYYERQQVGPLISTITDDINAVQEFASTSLLDIVIDVLTIVGMLAVMFTLNWRFTLVALAVTPLVVVFVSRLRWDDQAATRDVRHGRARSSRCPGRARLHPRRQSVRAGRVRAAAAGARRAARASRRRCTRAACGRCSGLWSLVAIGTAVVLWFGARLVLAGA